MSNISREILKDALVFVAVLALGLIAAWIVVKVQKPDAPDELWQRVPPEKP